MSITKDQELKLKRQIFFSRCKTKEDLHNWIQIFLDIDLPGEVISDTSTTSPMDFMWELYSKAIDGKDESYTEVLTYAGRDCGKTLLASIMEILAIFHLNRSVIHLAAIIAQSDKCVEYVRKHLDKPILKDFFVGAKNKRISEVVWYQGAESRLSGREFDALSDIDKNNYQRKSYYIKILVATMQSVNSDHTSLMVLDEAEVFPSPKIIQESAGVLTSGENKELPIRLLTSTRKFAGGIVQDIIDQSSVKGTQIRHWNIIDVTENCPVTRHLPEEPKIPIYVNEKTLAAVSEESFNNLSIDKQKDFEQHEGYSGCLKKCKIFAACKGNLATKQTSRSKFLKPISLVQTKIQGNSPEWVKAQLLCLKPSTEGMVYPRIDRDLHAISASEMARKLTGNDSINDNVSKGELIEIMRNHEGYFTGGMDWGFVCAYGGAVAFVDGYRMFVIDAWEISGLELSEKLEVADKVMKPYNCQAIWADTAYPDHIKTFQRNGFKMKQWQKNAGSVLAGIEITRMKLNPTYGAEPQIYFLRDDPGCELLIKRIASYKWKTDAIGNPTTVPDKTDSDLLDAFRYMTMNTFAPKGRLMTAEGGFSNNYNSSIITPDSGPKNWMQKIIQENIGGGYSDPNDFNPILIGRGNKK